MMNNNSTHPAQMRDRGSLLDRPGEARHNQRQAARLLGLNRQGPVDTIERYSMGRACQ